MGTVITRANQAYTAFLHSGEGTGFCGQVGWNLGEAWLLGPAVTLHGGFGGVTILMDLWSPQVVLLGDCVGGILGFDALCQSRAGSGGSRSSSRRGSLVSALHPSSPPGEVLGVHRGLHGVWVFAVSPCRAWSPSPQSSAVALTHWLMGQRGYLYWGRPVLRPQGHRGTTSSPAPRAGEPKGEWLATLCFMERVQFLSAPGWEGAFHGGYPRRILGGTLLELLWDNRAMPGTALPS